MHGEREKKTINLVSVIGLLCLIIMSACASRNEPIARTYLLGIRIQDLTDNVRLFIGIRKGITGVVVQEAAPDLIGHQSGIVPGDVITHIDGWPMINVREALRRVNSSNGTIDIRGVRIIDRGHAFFSKRAILMKMPKSIQEVVTESKHGDYFSQMLKLYFEDLFKESQRATPL